jgi:hypothetical protein
MQTRLIPLLLFISLFSACKPAGEVSGDAAADRGECAIKGNIGSGNDRVFHVPGSPAYSQTVIDETKGERWFCTTQEALDAGWHAPRGWLRSAVR